MRQTLSCLMITAGVLLATFADSSARSSAPCCDNEGRQTTDNAADDGTLATWMFGVSLLVISLVLSAVLGHCQEWGYRKYGRHPQYAAIGLPMWYAPRMLTRALLVSGRICSIRT